MSLDQRVNLLWGANMLLRDVLNTSEMTVKMEGAKEAAAGKDLGAIAVYVVVVVIVEMMWVAIAIKISAVDLTMRATIRMEIGRKVQDNRVPTSVDQDVPSIVPMKSINKSTVT